MKREKVLVIEDEPDILEVMEYNLAREGFQVFSSRDGERGLDMVREKSPQLVLLDLMLPGLDGIEVCRRMKQDDLTREIPIMIVTAKGEESDVVLGLGMGADDYITKPFSPRELVARVKAVLRRGPVRAEGAAAERVVRGPVVIDAGRHEVTVAGAPVPLTATEFRLLHCLAAHPGRVFTREQLLNRVIGENAVVVDRNIDVHVRSIRAKLADERDAIETVRGVGYRYRDADA